MAKEKSEEKHGKAGKGGKKLHLHEIRSTYAKDGSIVHHHTYKDHADAEYTQPERGPMATSTSPDEAGQHVSEMFGMNGGQDQAQAQQGGGDQGGDEEAAEAGAQQGGGAPPEQGE